MRVALVNQKIGNWPGVTIEKKTGKIIDTDIDLIDLPGIYSLNAYTKEEEVTSKFLLQEGADTIINIIDCNSIARGLYLTMQLLKCNLDVIVALNMHEFAERQGIQIDEKKLSQELNNIPVIKISAITGQGIEKIIQSLTKETRHLFKSVQSLSKIKQNLPCSNTKAAERLLPFQNHLSKFLRP